MGLNFKLDIGFNKLEWQAGLICTLAGSNFLDANPSEERASLIDSLAAKLFPQAARATELA